MWPMISKIRCLTIFSLFQTILILSRDVNKDLTPKDQDKDLTPKDKDKDLTPKDKDLTPRTWTKTTAINNTNCTF